MLIITKENEDTPLRLAGSNRGEREDIYICVERQSKLRIMLQNITAYFSYDHDND